MVKLRKISPLAYALGYIIFLLTILSSPVLAETITFSDLGIAKEFTSDNEGATPVGTFSIPSNDQSLEIVVNAYRGGSFGYILTIYLNDAPIKTQEFNGDGTFLVTIPPENVKKGLNKIYMKAASSNQYWFFTGSNKLTIYGTSTITYPDIIVISSPAPSITTTTIPVLTQALTFSDLGIAKEFTSGNEGTTTVGTFSIPSNNQSLEIVVNAYRGGSFGYILTIYLNDAPIKTQEFKGDGTFLVTIPPENLQKGLNKIYVKAASSNQYWFFSGSYKLTIYGTSKISYSSIILPSASPTSTPAQALTPAPTPIPTKLPLKSAYADAPPNKSETNWLFIGGIGALLCLLYFPASWFIAGWKENNPQKVLKQDPEMGVNTISKLMETEGKEPKGEFQAELVEKPKERKIEKRRDVTIFQNIHIGDKIGTQVKDSFFQRSNIGTGTRKCPNCGREADANEKFCLECGTKL